MKLAFLGAGKIATAIGKGLVNKNVFPMTDMAATDINPEARAFFTRATGISCAADAHDIIPSADAVLIAVKPQSAEHAIRPIADLCRDKLIISIAAGLPIARLAEWFGTGRVIRVMPNTPAMVGHGAAVYACGDGVSELDKEYAYIIFTAVGSAMEMSEDKLDAVTALSGSGPAYMFELLRCLITSGQTIGLSAEASLELATQTMVGAAEMVRQKVGTAEELRNAVTSPGGTTAAGLKVLHEAGFEDLIVRMLTAARDRSIDLGKS